MLTVKPPVVNMIIVTPAEAGNARWYDNVGNRQDVMVTESGGTKVHGYC